MDSIKVFDTKYGQIAIWRNDTIIANEMEKGKIFEQDEIEMRLAKYIKASNVILDIGGHIGSHTVMYHKLNPDAFIHIFEPQKKMFELLKKNVLKNCSPNSVITYSCAVGHCTNRVKMSASVSDGPNPGKPVQYGTNEEYNLGGLALGNDGEEVNMITIDSLSLYQCDFIKIDVEGFEPLVVMGARETIDKFHPVITFECNEKTITDSMCRFFEFKKEDVKTTKELLENHGYTVNPTTESSENYIAIWAGGDQG